MQRSTLGCAETAKQIFYIKIYILTRISIYTKNESCCKASEGNKPHYSCWALGGNRQQICVRGTQTEFFTETDLVNLLGILVRIRLIRCSRETVTKSHTTYIRSLQTLQALRWFYRAGVRRGKPLLCSGAKPTEYLEQRPLKGLAFYGL